MTPPSLKNLAPKNPLSIVALFISLIYGISALLLGASVRSLSSVNQLILVIFIALFPLCILAAFYRLVTMHHQKLYAPGDYRSDEGFLATGAAPKSLGERLSDEITRTQEAEAKQPAENVVVELVGTVAAKSTATGAIEVKSLTDEGKVNKDNVERLQEKSLIYMLEGLSLLEVQMEFGEPIWRETLITLPMNKRLPVTGYLSGNQIAIDVVTSQDHDVILTAIRRMGHIQHEANNLPNAPKLTGMIIAISSSSDNQMIILELMRNHCAEYSPPLEYRVFSRSYLFERYGI